MLFYFTFLKLFKLFGMIRWALNFLMWQIYLNSYSVLALLTLSCIHLNLDGLRERVHPVGRSEVSAVSSPVHLEHEDQHVPG